MSDHEALNLSVLAGPCSGPPEIRTLRSGSRLASLAVRVPSGNGKGTSVPVTVWNPPGWVETLDGGDEIVVVGRVQRRFFRVATGGTGSRVEVEAEAIARAGDGRRRSALRRRAETALSELA
jgi:single-stranded DNA-binding protein